MKKKILALALVVCLLGVAVVSSTLAYFTDSEQATNVFTVGNIDIELEEEVDVLDVDGKSLGRTKVIATENGASYRNIMPTNYLKKEVTITNLENPAYVRVLVVMNNHLELWEVLEDAIDQEVNNDASIPADQKDAKKVEMKNDLYNEIFDGWNITFTGTEACGSVIDASKIDNVLAVDTTISIAGYHLFDDANIFQSAAEQASHDEVLEASEGGLAAGQYAPIMNSYERCYVYYMYLEEDESVTLFKGLNCPADFTQAQAKIFENLKIEVYADAIQAESFAKNNPTNLDNAKKAFEALEVAHPLTALRTIDGTEVADSTEFSNAVNGNGGTVVLTTPVEWATGAGGGSTPFEGTEDITIIGDGTEDTAFTATGSGVGSIGSDTQTVTFKNLIINDESKSYAEDAWEFTYLEFRGKLVFENCVFTSGILLERDADATFIGCIFNTPNPSEYSVWVSDGKATFDNCYFTGYRGLKLHEAYGSNVDSVVVKNSTFENITKKPGIAIGDVDATTVVTLTDNEFIKCQPGDQGKYIYESDTDVTTFQFSYHENNSVRN